MLFTGPGFDVGVFGTVDDLGDVLEVDRRAVAVGDDQLGIFVGVKQLVIGCQGRNAAFTIQCAFGQVQAGLLDRLAQVGQGQAEGGEFFRLGLDADRRAQLAGNVDQADPIDLTQLPGQQGFGVVAQFVGRHLVRADREDQHRAVSWVDLAPGGWAGHVLGQTRSGRVDRCLDFLGGGIDAFFQGELQNQVG
ncbi:hypothetical protein D3C80_356950 [compost metagenome]